MDFLSIANLMLVFLVGFCVRLVFATLSNSSDQWFSLWNIKRQKRNRWITTEIDKNVNEGINAYPSLCHFIVSKFPERHWNVAARLFNIIPDIIVGFFLLVILNSIDISTYAAGQIDRNLFLTLLLSVYFLSCSLFPPSARLIATNGRVFGYMLYVILMALCFIILGEDFSFSARATAFFGGGFAYILIILSSQFSFQAATFSLLFLSIFYLSPFPALIAAVVLIDSYIYKGLKSWDVIRYWWAHKRWYSKNVGYFKMVHDRNSVKDLFCLPWKVFKDPRDAAQIIFQRNSYISLIYMNSCLFFIAYIGFQYGFDFDNQILKFCFAVTGINLIAFFLTSQKPLIHFGQAERYFEYATPFYIVAYAYMALSLSETAFIKMGFLLLLLNITAIFLNMLFLNRQKFLDAGITIDQADRDAIGWINGNLHNKKIACNPIKLGKYFSYFDCSDNKYYYGFLLQDGEKEFEEYVSFSNGFFEHKGKFIKDFYSCSLPPSQLKKQYDIHYMVIAEKFLSGYKKVAGEEFKDLKLAFSNGKYQIYQL